MRTPTIIALLVSTMMAPVAADAQRMGDRTAPNGNWSQTRTGNWNAPRPGQAGNWNGPRPMRQNQTRQPRWGDTVDGRWYAGIHAPGGWNAYRRPARGWTLPRYWVAPSFFIDDYETYGLSTPPAGYTWSRYYDDAVLVDQRGQVWDTVGGVEWDRYDDGFRADDSYYADGYDGHAQYRDRAEYGVSYAPPREVVQSGGYSTTSYGSGYQQGGYVSGGYWYPPTTQTVVTLAAPVTTTTTTTEYVETRYVAPRRVWKAKKVAWKPRPKVRSCTCVCSMVCR